MRAIKLIVRMEVNSPEAEYTEFAEREFESEGGLRDAYNAVLDLLEDTHPGEVTPPEQYGPGYPKSEVNPGGY